MVPNDTDPLLSVAKAARRAGVAPGTWRSYRSRGRVPPPDDADDSDPDIPPERRRPRWRASTVDAYLAGRLRQGHRSDIDAARAERRHEFAVELAEPLRYDGPALSEWLRANQAKLVVVADTLVDHRDVLLEVAGAGDRDRLAEAIDRAGELMSRTPTRGFASAISYALFLLDPDRLAQLSADGELHTVLVRHRRLRDEFEALRSR